jgi:hypothetical protein
MSLPATLTIATKPGSDGSVELCDAFLEFYGYIFVSETLYEVVTVSPCADAQGRWTWTLRLVTYAGRA